MEVSCHGIPYCIQWETFYNGLFDAAKINLVTIASVAFIANTYNGGPYLVKVTVKPSGKPT